MCGTLCQDRRDNQFQVALPEVPSSLRGSVDVCSIRQVLPHRSSVRRVEVVQRTFQKLWKFTLIKGIIKVNDFLIIELGKV
jgi:hypothetical protein